MHPGTLLWPLGDYTDWPDGGATSKGQNLKTLKGHSQPLHHRLSFVEAPSRDALCQHRGAFMIHRGRHVYGQVRSS